MLKFKHPADKPYCRKQWPEEHMKASRRRNVQQASQHNDWLTWNNTGNRVVKRSALDNWGINLASFIQVDFAEGMTASLFLHFDEGSCQLSALCKFTWNSDNTWVRAQFWLNSFWSLKLGQAELETQPSFQARVFTCPAVDTYSYLATSFCWGVGWKSRPLAFVSQKKNVREQHQEGSCFCGSMAPPAPEQKKTMLREPSRNSEPFPMAWQHCSSSNKAGILSNMSKTHHLTLWPTLSAWSAFLD